MNIDPPVLKGEAKARELIAEGRLLAAVKHIHDENGVDMMTAKRIVEKMRGPVEPRVYESPARFAIYNDYSIVTNSINLDGVIVSIGAPRLTNEQRAEITLAIQRTLNLKFGPR